MGDGLSATSKRAAVLAVSSAAVLWSLPQFTIPPGSKVNRQRPHTSGILVEMDRGVRSVVTPGGLVDQVFLSRQFSRPANRVWPKRAGWPMLAGNGFGNLGAGSTHWMFVGAPETPAEWSQP